MDRLLHIIIVLLFILIFSITVEFTKEVYKGKRIVEVNRIGIFVEYVPNYGGKFYTIGDDTLFQVGTYKKGDVWYPPNYKHIE